MQYKPQTMYVKFNDKIYIPATTTFKFFTGVQNIDKILLQVKNNVALDSAVAGIREKFSHKQNGRRDFILSTQEQFLATLTETSRTLNVLLGTVAAISLIVGGICIMDIMLVSVIERTKEIGIRIAVGATPADIIKQFIMESITRSSVRGLVGIMVGILSSNATGTLFTLI
jgi:ABC-type antimicrobial peptide transport system permease subunit